LMPYVNFAFGRRDKQCAFAWVPWHNSFARQHILQDLTRGSLPFLQLLFAEIARYDVESFLCVLYGMESIVVCWTAIHDGEEVDCQEWWIVDSSLKDFRSLQNALLCATSLDFDVIVKSMNS
jgi:hypothetical protein